MIEIDDEMIDIGCMLVGRGWVGVDEIEDALNYGDSLAIKRSLSKLAHISMIVPRRWFGRLQFRAAGYLADCKDASRYAVVTALNSRDMGISSGLPRKEAKAEYQRRLAQEREFVLQLARQHNNVRDIVVLTGRPRSTVQKWIKAEGLGVAA